MFISRLHCSGIAAAAETRVAAAMCRTRGCSIVAPVTRNAVAVPVRTGLTSSGPVVALAAGWPLEKVSGRCDASRGYKGHCIPRRTSPCAECNLVFWVTRGCDFSWTPSGGLRERERGFTWRREKNEGKVKNNSAGSRSSIMDRGKMLGAHRHPQPRVSTRSPTRSRESEVRSGEDR